jgi:hypothetical protein
VKDKIKIFESTRNLSAYVKNSRKCLSLQETSESVARVSSTKSLICSPKNVIVPAMIPDQDQVGARNKEKDVYKAEFTSGC